jgi:hypothetical protein
MRVCKDLALLPGDAKYDTSGLLDGDLSRWIRRRRRICISPLPASPTFK